MAACGSPCLSLSISCSLTRVGLNRWPAVLSAACDCAWSVADAHRFLAAAGLSTLLVGLAPAGIDRPCPSPAFDWLRIDAAWKVRTAFWQPLAHRQWQ